MKKFFFSAAIAAALFASCDKNDGDSITKPVEGSIVNLSFVDSNITRAFFDDSAASEQWETGLTKVTIFAFNSANDELIVRRDLNEEEIANQKTKFALPGTSVDDVVDIVVVANSNISQDIVTLDALSQVMESNLLEYNGTFDEVSGSSKREAGFVMTACNEVTVEDGTTQIQAALERTVSKVAMQLAVSDKFKKIYSGDVRVDNVVVGNTPSSSTLHKSFQTENSLGKDFSFTQQSNKESTNYQNLFYIYESETPTTQENRVSLTINATYDMDGDFETTNDQTPITYNLTIEDEDNITKIDRNSYYRINGSIDGLDGSDASLSITVSDWAIVANKNIGLGQ
ncbi:MAG: hypothetical protein R3Y50_10215 [Rikenellaceae bacterium]